jgi:hypothetical protein
MLATLGLTLAAWPLVLRTLAISVLMLLALTWVVTPTLTRLFHAWLAAEARRPGRRHRADHTTGPTKRRRCHQQTARTSTSRAPRSARRAASDDAAIPSHKQ